MPPPDQPPADELAARFDEPPFLRDFAVRLNIPAAAGALEETFSSLAQQVRWQRPPAVVQFTIAEGAHTRSWSLELSRSSCAVSGHRSERPDLEIVTTDQVWLEMMRGALSPLDAFGRGQMRVRGNVEVARALVRRLCEA